LNDDTLQLHEEQSKVLLLKRLRKLDEDFVGKLLFMLYGKENGLGDSTSTVNNASGDSVTGLQPLRREHSITSHTH